jgi:putative transposase
MARKERITEVGFYHIINRGVERRDVFLESEDYDYFLDLLSEMKKIYSITIHTYCLMTNHYHIVLEITQPNVSQAIKFLNSFYSIYFNKKYKRSGHLWQGRFASYYLYDDAHFWIVAKYIERNPIKANIIHEISHYKYQSFFQWKHNDEYFSLLENSKIFDMTLEEYQEYIGTELEVNALDTVYVSPALVFKDGEMKILSKRLETFFEKDRDINRNQNIKKAYEYGYTKTEIAKLLNLSSKSISNILDFLIENKE